MASIRRREGKRGRTYQVEIRIRGQRPVCRSFKRLTDAKRWALQTEAAIRERRYFRTAEAERHTFGETINRYLSEVDTSRVRVSQLEWWKERLGHRVLADVTTADITECRTNLTRRVTRGGTRIAPATVNRYLAALSHCYSVAVNEWEWLEQSPMTRVRKLKEPRGRVRVLDDEERQRLLEACGASDDPYLDVVVILALSTGARQGEIMNLRWADVDLKRKMAVIHETKNNERRALPLASLALKKLRAFAKVRRLDSDFLFPNRNGSKPADLRNSWLQVLQAAQIEDFRFHDLRHCAASYLAMNGASLPEIAAVLGHRTLAMVKRYAHLSQDHTAHVVESMNRKIFQTK